MCDLGRLGEALEIARRVLSVEPNDATALCLVARVELAHRNYRAALENARRAAAAAPFDEWPHRLTSVALGGLGEHQLAFDSATEAVRLAPLQWQPHVRLAMAAANLAIPRMARASALRAMELGPQDSRMWTAVGEVALALQATSDADAAFRHALELDPQNSAAHNGLGRVELRSAKRAPSEALARAVRSFAVSVRANPHAQADRHNIDVVVRSQLVDAAYLLLVNSLLTLLLAAGRARLLLSLVGVALLLAVAIPLARFFGVLTPQIRVGLRRSLLRGWNVLGISVLAAAAVFELASLVGPAQVRMGVAYSATAAAVFARLVLARPRAR